MATTTNYRTKGDVTVRYVDGTEGGVDFDAAYTVDRYSGVAWRLQGWLQDWKLGTTLVLLNEDGEYDPDGEETEVESDEGEWVDDRDRVVAVMVGDDRYFVFWVDEVHPIPEDGYCHGCGQTSCMAERWD